MDPEQLYTQWDRFKGFLDMPNAHHSPDLTARVRDLIERDEEACFAMFSSGVAADRAYLIAIASAKRN